MMSIMRLRLRLRTLWSNRQSIERYISVERSKVLIIENIITVVDCQWSLWTVTDSTVTDSPAVPEQSVLLNL